MQIIHKESGKVVRVYAKIDWSNHSNAKFLYMVTHEKGGGGSMHNGRAVLWVDPSLERTDDEFISDNFSWVSSKTYDEVTNITNNEDALALLIREELI